MDVTSTPPARAPDAPASDHHGWGAWYGGEATRLVRFAAFVGGADRAADLVQIAMVRALRSATLPEDRRAYVHRIIVHEAHRLAARETRRDELELWVVPWPGADRTGEDAPIAVAEHPELHAAVRALSAQQRAVVFHTYWEDLTPAQIADLLGCSEGTVRRQLARGRARLRKALR